MYEKVFIYYTNNVATIPFSQFILSRGDLLVAVLLANYITGNIDVGKGSMHFTCVC